MRHATDSATRIESIVGSNRVVLFMKGTREMPQCGFSAATVGILDSLLPNYETINVLEDQSIREGIKQFSSWPTIPQLYVDQEFVGGCDIVKQMFNTGALHEMLGADLPDRTPPKVAVSDDAKALIINAVEGNPGMAVHLQIDARWQHNLTLGAVEGHEVKADCAGVDIYLDVGSAQKANGLSLGLEDTLQGTAFSIENPNAPPTVKQLSAEELKSRLNAAGELTLIDVRPASERAQAQLDGAWDLEGEGQTRIEALPKDTPLVFYCNLGQRSQAAAEHFRLQGFTEVYNLTGGIDAWSLQVDSAVPRY